MSSCPADKGEISASFGKEIFAVSWTWHRFPFPGPLNFFTASGGLRGISNVSGNSGILHKGQTLTEDSSNELHRIAARLKCQNVYWNQTRLSIIFQEIRQHFLYFRPLPHGHGSLRPALKPAFESSACRVFMRASGRSPARRRSARRSRYGRAWEKKRL